MTVGFKVNTHIEPFSAMMQMFHASLDASYRDILQKESIIGTKSLQWSQNSPFEPFQLTRLSKYFVELPFAYAVCTTPTLRSRCTA